MMTSPSTNRIPSLARSVRDVVSHQPDLVNEVWCRKIFRQILQALERDHALGRAHAPITPDTVGIDEHGEPALMPAEAGAPEPGEAADVQSLGMLIHYAITQEETPTMSLRRRGLAGYSDSLVTAVDKCGAANPADRPQSIAALRNLLGIVALGPAVGAPATNPVFMQAAALPRVGGLAGMGKWQRWMLMGLAGIVLLAAASAFWMLLRGTSNGDNVVLTLPSAEQAASAPAPDVPPAPPAQAPRPQPAAQSDQQERSRQAAQAALADPAPAAPPASTEPARARLPVATPARERAAPRTDSADTGTTTFKLMIKPWGTVYVDGGERGVSPPLKTLTLPAGNHTVRVVNPNFRDRIMKVHAISHGSGRIDVDFTD